MRVYDVPDCIVEFLARRDLVDSDYLLYGSGRALCWLKMSADAIKALPNEGKEAEYHAYAGISAARTAIDALANWMNAMQGLGSRGLAVDFKKKPFKKLIEEHSPSLFSPATQLGDLAAEIDEHRQRAQHREGLALVFYNAEGTDAQGGWHLAPHGLQGARSTDIYLPDMLLGWSTTIEVQMCATIPRRSKQTRY